MLEIISDKPQKQLLFALIRWNPCALVRIELALREGRLRKGLDATAAVFCHLRNTDWINVVRIAQDF